MDRTLTRMNMVETEKERTKRIKKGWETFRLYGVCSWIAIAGMLAFIDNFKYLKAVAIIASALVALSLQRERI